MCTIFFFPLTCQRYQLTTYPLFACFSRQFYIWSPRKKVNMPIFHWLTMFKVRGWFHYRGPENHCSPILFVPLWGAKEGNLIFLIYWFLSNMCWKDRANSFHLVLIPHPNACHLPFRERNCQVGYTQSNCQQPVPSHCSQENCFCLFGNVCGDSFPAAWAVHEHLGIREFWAAPCEDWCKCCLEHWRRPQCTLYRAAKCPLPVGKIFRMKAEVCFQELLSSAVLP